MALERHGMAGVLAFAALVMACPREVPPSAAAPGTGAPPAAAPGPSAAPTVAPAETPAPAPAATNTRADTDGDGLADVEDACPGDPGPDVGPDQRGCPRHVRLTPNQLALLSPIEFELDKAKLRPSSMPIIDELAFVLSMHPEIRLVEVRGHGPEDPHRSRLLSRDRAQSVRAALVAKGIDPARLTAQGYGESQPLALPGTEEGKRLNRRIELWIMTPAPPP